MADCSGTRKQVLILAVGVFSIINTEMGVVGLLPAMADKFQVSIAEAGLLVSLFAMTVAFAGPAMPLVFSNLERKKTMLLVLGIFCAGNIVSMLTDDFQLLLAVRIITAVFHPVYCAMAFATAALFVPPAESPKAVAKIVAGVSAGMVAGVPISNFLASEFSLTVAFGFFAAMNAAAFMATLFIMPTMTVTERKSCMEQLKVLKKPELLVSIMAVVLMNGAVFGVFSYLAEYLRDAAVLPAYMISIVLLLYGIANIIGSMIAGNLLVRYTAGTIKGFGIVLTAVYIMLWWNCGNSLLLIPLIFLWGVIGGIGANINQFWISNTAREAPDFANGLFLTAANLGTMLATMLCGQIIVNYGIWWLVSGGIGFAVMGLLVIAGQFRWQKAKIFNK